MKQSLVEIGSGINQDSDVRARSALDNGSKVSQLKESKGRTTPNESFMVIIDKLEALKKKTSLELEQQRKLCDSLKQ